MLKGHRKQSFMFEVSKRLMNIRHWYPILSNWSNITWQQYYTSDLHPFNDKLSWIRIPKNGRYLSSLRNWWVKLGLHWSLVYLHLKNPRDWIYPPHPVTVAVNNSLLKMQNNPGGDWNPRWGGRCNLYIQLGSYAPPWSKSIPSDDDGPIPRWHTTFVVTPRHDCLRKKLPLSSCLF